MIVENLLTVRALNVLFLHDVEANGAEEWIHKLLVGIGSIFPH